MADFNSTEAKKIKADLDSAGSLITQVYRTLSNANAAYGPVARELTAAKDAATAAKSGFDAAKAAKDATDRMAKEAARAKINREYIEATEAKDVAAEDLQLFKDGFEDWDTAELDADQQGELE